MKLSDLNFRLNLKESTEPYWFKIREGLYIGYRKGPLKNMWLARHIISGEKRYRIIRIGEADNDINSDNRNEIGFDEAFQKCITFGNKFHYRRTYTDKLKPSKPEK